MKKLFKAIVLALVTVCAGAAAQAQLPAAQLKDINGKVVDTSTLSNDGNPMIISLFATWCKPCLRELKAINEVYADWQDETGVRLVAISIDEAQNANKVKPLVDAEGWEYQVLLDPNNDFGRTLGVQMIPHMVIVDGQGQIVLQHSGYTDGSESEIIEKIREMVK